MVFYCGRDCQKKEWKTHKVDFLFFYLSLLDWSRSNIQNLGDLVLPVRISEIYFQTNKKITFTNIPLSAFFVLYLCITSLPSPYIWLYINVQIMFPSFSCLSLLLPVLLQFITLVILVYSVPFKVTIWDLSL